MQELFGTIFSLMVCRDWLLLTVEEATKVVSYLKQYAMKNFIGRVYY